MLAYLKEVDGHAAGGRAVPVPAVVVVMVVGPRAVAVGAAVLVVPKVRLPVPSRPLLIAPLGAAAAAALAAALRLRGGPARIQQLVEVEESHGCCLQGLGRFR